MSKLHCVIKATQSLCFTTPKFKKDDQIDDDIVAIAIDSTGLKRFGKDEWHQEKHKINAKRSWRKAHLGVSGNHLIQGAVLTHKDVMDDQVVDAICAQITEPVVHITADKMYDTDAVHHPKRMSNLIAYSALGITRWQRLKHYGRRNVSETAMQRYKKIIGPKLHSRKFNNQQQEMLMACSILNRFVHLGMPNSYRVA